MKSRTVTVGDEAPTLRVLLRRSKDEGQEFSLDVQRELSLAFGEQLRNRNPASVDSRGGEFTGGIGHGRCRMFD